MMTSSTPRSYGVIVLGDHDTGRRAEMLAEKAAEHGATITEIHTFEPGQAGSHDDLAEVDAVITALSRAICAKTKTGRHFRWRISSESSMSVG